MTCFSDSKKIIRFSVTTGVNTGGGTWPGSDADPGVEPPE